MDTLSDQLKEITPRLPGHSNKEKTKCDKLNLKIKTAQNNAVKTNYVKAKINETLVNRR